MYVTGPPHLFLVKHFQRLNSLFLRCNVKNKATKTLGFQLKVDQVNGTTPGEETIAGVSSVSASSEQMTELRAL